MKNQRPVNMSLTDWFPLTAWVSIVHRMTGLLLVLSVGLGLYLLSMALSSVAGFAEAKAVMNGTLVQLLIWLSLVALFYHLTAGVKHLLLDMHVGDTYQASKRGAQTVLVLSLMTAVLLGMWIW